jgi:SAM-dependent methyltransferase
MPVPDVETEGSPYYGVTRHVPLALQLSLRVRRAMFERFVELMAPTAACRVLDLGVTGETGQSEANYFEQWYPYPDRIVCAGIEDASHLERRYPGLTFTRIRAHEPLPFADRQFDIVFSNAVVEHAGSREQQRCFVGEAVRVARRFFITTPNRWFPVEMHTALPLLHYLPPRAHRRLLSAVGMRYWSSEAHLNLLDARSLRALFPSDLGVTIAPVRLGGIVSNLIAHSPARAHR